MKNNNNDRKQQLLNKFLKVFVITFAMLLVITGLSTGIYLWATKGDKGNPIVDVSGNKDGIEKDDNDDDPKEETLKKVTTFAVFGTDKEGYRTDVTMLVFFNSETQKIDIISVPRDTMVKIPDDLYEKISEKRNVDQTVKINEVPAYVDSSDRNDASVTVLEANLGIDIDYFMKLELSDFIDIVDLVGPITVEIPFDMYYTDEVQDLYINLKEGTREVNGAEAEGLIRYRKGYANGDIGRIDMQHEFMKAFVKELLTVENKMNIINIAQAALTYLETDFVNAIDYVNFIDDLSLENMKIYTLPGEGKMLERSYYVLDAEKTNQMLASIFAGEEYFENVDAIEQINEADLVDIKTLKISVQNGTNISKFASKNKTMLEAEGYTVTEATDYDGTKPVAKTKLIVPSEKIGDALKEYFNNPDIEIDETIFKTDKQVIIVLGESDGDV